MQITLNSEINNLVPSERSYKGKSLLELPDHFTVIDIETTGLSPRYDSIIEVAAIKVFDNVATVFFSSLVRYDHETYIDDFISFLTGITQEMVDNAPNISTVLPNYMDFIGDDIVIGHRVSFDINFIYDEMMSRYGRPFSNNYVDTMRLSRRLYPDIKHHRLKDVAEMYGIDHIHGHRALADCKTTLACYEALRNDINTHGGLSLIASKPPSSIRAADIHASKSEFDETHPLYQKVCVFTGKLEKMTRAEAMQIVADIGGLNGDGVTKKTNYLILGNNDYCGSIKDGKSTKQKRAEALIEKGADLEIIPENVFYELIFEES